jgi:hypothetical protein
MSFPILPVNGQTATMNGITYVYNSVNGTWTRQIGQINNWSANAFFTANGLFWSNSVNYSTTLPFTNYSNSNVSTYLLTTTANIGNVATNGLYWLSNGNVMSTGINYTASTTPPATANNGDQWYNTASDTVYEYTFDGTNEYWIDVTTPVVVATGNGLVNTTTSANLVAGTGGNAYISANLIPTSNVSFNLGSPTNRFQSLYLSGNTIDLGGAVIKTDATSGAIALVPLATVSNPNPTGIVITPTGTITTITTIGGNISAGSFSNAANSSSTTTTFSNLTVTGNIVTGGIFWSNGTAYSSGSGASISSGNQGIYFGKTTAGTSATLIDSIASAGTSTVSWKISSVDNINNNFKTSTVDIVNTGSTVLNNEYAVILSNSIAHVSSFSCNISNGNINLWSVGDSANVSVTFERTILGSSSATGFMTGATGATGATGNIASTSGLIVTTNTTPTTNTTSGALQVAGGAGIAGDLFLGGNLSIGAISELYTSSSQTNIGHGATLLDSFLSSQYRSAKYIVTTTDNINSA